MEEAAIMFKHAMEINPMDMNIFFYQGMMYEESGESGEAAKAYRKALESILALEN